MQHKLGSKLEGFECVRLVRELGSKREGFEYVRLVHAGFACSNACMEFDCMCVKLCMHEVEGRTLLLK
jgi:hypothetical protein